MAVERYLFRCDFLVPTGRVGCADRALLGCGLTEPRSALSRPFSNAGRPLSIRQMIPLMISERKLDQRIAQVHDRERRSLAWEEKTLAKQANDRILAEHRAQFHALRAEQAKTRAAEHAHQGVEHKGGLLPRRKKN